MIYENATIITVDPKRRIIYGGAIAVSGSRIAGVGKRQDIINQFGQEDQERHNLEGMVVIPGLINTHVHQSQALIRGCADDMALIDWLIKRVWVLQGNYDEDDGRVSAELCILEILKSGTTAFVETMIAGHYGFDGIARVVQSSGIRAALSKIIMDISTYAEEDANSMHVGMREDPIESFQDALTMHEKWEGGADGRIQVWFGPRPPGGCSSELYRKMMGAANERGMGVTVHMAEVKEDVEYLRNSFDMTPVEYCESVGMVGPRVLLIHCVQLEGDDIIRLADTGTHVTHNPLSNSKLASGIAPIAEMLEAGVNVSLGTDGGPSNNGYDMINDMRWASYLQKIRRDDPTVTPAEAVLEMATINGAKAMGLEDQIGSIEVGKQADFTALNMNKPRLTPAPDPVSAIVFAGCGSDVDTVVIGGKLVVKGGEVLTMDEGRILTEANERARKVYERAGINYGPRWPAA
jgi:cytosine/adenosine deaminase-related metal-dependent hydrolase